MNDSITILITWTTYGTWIPGDKRGWRKRKAGQKLPQPLLADWCRRRMTGDVVLLKPNDRRTIESAYKNHCEYRGWHLFAVNARTNHVHVVVAAVAAPQTVRDQLKANCTKELRRHPTPLNVAKTWTKGGDCEVLDTDDDVHDAVLYVIEGQEKPAASAVGSLERP